LEYPDIWLTTEIEVFQYGQKQNIKVSITALAVRLKYMSISKSCRFAFLPKKLPITNLFSQTALYHQVLADIQQCIHQTLIVPSHTALPTK
jgi:hypothetical protein